MTITKTSFDVSLLLLLPMKSGTGHFFDSTLQLHNLPAD